MHKVLILIAVISLTSFISCNNNEKEEEPNMDLQKGTFGYDLNFLNQYDSMIVLQSANGDAQLIVSPKYQAKVFTSTANGLNGNSFGWINYSAFDAPLNEHMNAYGGENRFWLGPEGGKYSLFFSKGDSMTFSHWKTPAPIDTESWDVLQKNEASVSMQKKMRLKNYAGTDLELLAQRSVTILSHNEIEQQIGTAIGPSVNAVGYTTENAITNTGRQQWDETTGMPCIWMLDMFPPSPKTVIIIPYKTAAQGKVATTDYFGEIAPDRIKYNNGVLLFKADGKSRGKLGLTPERAKPVAGSYDAQNNILTITIFDVDTGAKYMAQEWNTEKPPFSGDAVNAYNDGPLEGGSQMGPFYEIESVSPAAFLKPGEKLQHQHAVFHFTGDESALDKIAQKVLGISLSQIKEAFNL